MNLPKRGLEDAKSSVLGSYSQIYYTKLGYKNEQVKWQLSKNKFAWMWMG